MVSVEPGLRIVFFGTPAFAVPALTALIESRHPVVAVVSQPDRPKGRGQQVPADADARRRRGRRCAGVSADEAEGPRLSRTGARRSTPDLGVVAAYGRLLPDALLALPRLGMINVHASLLPRYRGAAPMHRAVIDGDAETGVTIMRVVTELDAGPMFAHVRLPIDPDATSRRSSGAGGRRRPRWSSRSIDQMAAARRARRRRTIAAATHAAEDRSATRARSTGRCRPPRSTTGSAACSRGRSCRRLIGGVRVPDSSNHRHRRTR